MLLTNIGHYITTVYILDVNVRNLLILWIIDIFAILRTLVQLLIANTHGLVCILCSLKRGDHCHYLGVRVSVRELLI